MALNILYVTSATSSYYNKNTRAVGTPPVDLQAGAGGQAPCVAVPQLGLKNYFISHNVSIKRV